jgi:hypothetical protein
LILFGLHHTNNVSYYSVVKVLFRRTAATFAVDRRLVSFTSVKNTDQLSTSFFDKATRLTAGPYRSLRFEPHVQLPFKIANFKPFVILSSTAQWR